jgi:hypothetical protein
MQKYRTSSIDLAIGIRGVDYANRSLYAARATTAGHFIADLQLTPSRCAEIKTNSSGTIDYASIVLAPSKSFENVCPLYAA